MQMRYSAPHLFPNILIRANKEGLERRSTIDMILSDRAPPIKDDIIIALLNINMIIIARSFCTSKSRYTQKSTQQSNNNCEK